MLAESKCEIAVEALLNDPYDGAIRLLGDAQRFGFEISGLALAIGEDGTASVNLTFNVPSTVDAQHIADRFSRHPVVRCVNAQVIANPPHRSQSSVAA
jgi:hypothetical protein